MRIESLNDWITWASSRGIGKTEAVKLASRITEISLRCVWQWVNGEKNMRPSHAHLLHVYAFSGDFYWISEKNEKS